MNESFDSLLHCYHNVIVCAERDRERYKYSTAYSTSTQITNHKQFGHISRHNNVHTFIFSYEKNSQYYICIAHSVLELWMFTWYVYRLYTNEIQDFSLSIFYTARIVVPVTMVKVNARICIKREVNTERKSSDWIGFKLHFISWTNFSKYNCTLFFKGYIKTRDSYDKC